MTQLAMFEEAPTVAPQPKAAPSAYTWRSSSRMQNSFGDRQLCAHEHANSIEARACAKARKVRFICAIGPLRYAGGASGRIGVDISYNLDSPYLGTCRDYRGESFDCARCGNPAHTVDESGDEQIPLCIDCDHAGKTLVEVAPGIFRMLPIGEAEACA